MKMTPGSLQRARLAGTPGSAERRTPSGPSRLARAALAEAVPRPDGNGLPRGAREEVARPRAGGRHRRGRGPISSLLLPYGARL